MLCSKAKLSKHSHASKVKKSSTKRQKFHRTPSFIQHQLPFTTTTESAVPPSLSTTVKDDTTEIISTSETPQPPAQSFKQKFQAYIEPPDELCIKQATTNGSTGINARKQIVNFFRNSARNSDLSQKCAEVPYLLPIGETSTKTYPIPEFLMHTLFHMSNTTLVNTGAGMAAPQFGINYKAFVLRSEFFGLISPITKIPYAIPYSDDTNAMVSPRHIQKKFPKPLNFEKIALSWDNPNPNWDRHSRPNVNVSKSGVDYHDIQQDTAFIQSRGGLEYLLVKNLKMPSRDEKQLNLCHDDLLVTISTDDEGNIKRRLAPSLSFINDYRGYSVPLEEIERLIFGPLLQAFNQQLQTSTFINPRVTSIRPEYWALREGCFSFPNWASFVSRPIAIDVEYETLEISSSQVPQVAKQMVDSALLSSALAIPPGSIEKKCPRVEDSGLDLNLANPQLTRQLEISRMLPPPEHVKLVTKRATFRDILAKSFLHEYDHLDGINFFDRAACVELSWQPPVKRQAEPEGHYAYPVKLGFAYF